MARPWALAESLAYVHAARIPADHATPFGKEADAVLTRAPTATGCLRRLGPPGVNTHCTDACLPGEAFATGAAAAVVAAFAAFALLLAACGPLIACESPRTLPAATTATVGTTGLPFASGVAREAAAAPIALGNAVIIPG